jgi:hypothetical protein
VAQIMYTHISKCKNDKNKIKKNEFKAELGVVMHIYNPSTWESKARQS